ncbi:hypothetical protein SAMN02927900_01713 [Rhizobium mongolense subsp. loessense]|uniref:Uncharacterized protein n=1 Tax=Rhizobium mongolense subsp. loessense TaxID=158890 RepID=A0A1G4QQD7_9HYPH|nr:hypothetical protein SAMN02927900_01713 [Rhizobium mongolense subsp. loessense]
MDARLGVSIFILGPAVAYHRLAPKWLKRWERNGVRSINGFRFETRSATSRPVMPASVNPRWPCPKA